MADNSISSAKIGNELQPQQDGGTAAHTAAKLIWYIPV